MERDAVPVTCMLTEPWVEEGDTVFEMDLPSSDKEYESETLPVFDEDDVFVGSFVSEMVGEPTVTDFVGVSSGVAELEREISQLRELDVLASCEFDAVADCVFDLLLLFPEPLMDWNAVIVLDMVGSDVKDLDIVTVAVIDSVPVTSSEADREGVWESVMVMSSVNVLLSEIVTVELSLIVIDIVNV
jgi:hypothetical protein